MKALQQELIRKGYDCGASCADGIFVKNTEVALKRFQQDHGLDTDGICGPLTYAALEEKTEMQLYTVHIPMLPVYKVEALLNAYSGAWMTKEDQTHDGL